MNYLWFNRLLLADLTSLLLVFGLGSIFGLLSFSHFLSWILRKFKDITLALLTGFILGSLSITWPWQKPIEWLQDKNGKFILKEGEKIIIKWEKEVPDFNTESIFAILIIALGFLIVYFLKIVVKIQNENIWTNW